MLGRLGSRTLDSCSRLEVCNLRQFRRTVGCYCLSYKAAASRHIRVGRPAPSANLFLPFWLMLAMRRNLRRTTITAILDAPAPKLICPQCGWLLVYRLSILGGIKPLERWDYLDCPKCGPFEYRHRTRAIRLREVTAA